MAMQVSSVGNYATNYAPVASGNTPQPPAGGAAFGQDSYQPASYQSAGSGLNIGRMAAWGGGIFAALKWLRPVFSSPSGWLTLGIAGVGWFAGEKLYQMITGK